MKKTIENYQKSMVKVKVKVGKREELKSSYISYDNYYGNNSTGILLVSMENTLGSGIYDSIMPLLFDKEGKILEIEVLEKPIYWKTNKNLTLPKNIVKGDVFIEQEENDPLDRGEEEYYINKNKDILYIQIEKEKPKQSIQIAKNIILDITDNNKLGGIWILNLPKNIL